MLDKLKFLCDENVERHIVLSLRKKGFDVTYISEDCPGVKDTEVLEIATAANRILLTEDKDFGDLVFRTSQLTYGVLLIRLSELPPLEASELVCNVVTAHGPDIVGRFAVVNSKALRIREIS